MDGGRGHGAEFIGEKGILIVDRDGITWRPKGDLDGPEDKDPGVQVSVAGPSAAARDFLDNVKNRGQCCSDVDSMHLTTTVCHLANISYLLGRSVRWVGARCLVVGDKEALRCRPYWREYRKPWELPVDKV